MPEPLIHIVDDDAQVRASTSFLLRSRGFVTEIYSNGREFMEEANLDRGCVLLDLCMPDMSGIEVLEALAARGTDLPVIMISGQGDIPTAVQAMKLGAADFLEKPYRECALIHAISRVCAESVETENRRVSRELAIGRVAELSSRERQVLQGLIAGLTNKGIARSLQLSVRTVEMHRARMLATLDVNSLAEAVRVAIDAQLEPLAADF